MALNLYTSNKLEILADKLAEIIKVSPSSPLEQEVIVVQSRGMERWVSIELARKNGICANTLFCFPNALLYDVQKRAIPDLPEISPYEPEVLRWKILKLLPECINKPGFETLSSYLNKGPPLKSFQIAERIADVFDRYLIFRPEMILAWEGGKKINKQKMEEKWQAELWRMVISDTNCSHRLRLMETFRNVMENDPSLADKLPERISVIGISYFPPFYMNFLSELANHIEVYLFLMNPCRQYWGHILSDSQASKLSQKYNNIYVQPEDLHFERGNALLATLGTRGAEFFDFLLESLSEQNELFEEITEESMLSCIQSDILKLQDRGAGPSEKKSVGIDDTSIQIHSCHSSMREIEALHDNLLSMFEEDPSLRPHDILVMTPDIDIYAPFIQAVFNSPEKENLRIPFSVADQTLLSSNSLCNALLSVFDLCGSRFAASEVMSIIESHAVMRKFCLGEDEVELIQSWITETRIRWGIDGSFREDAGFPAFRENTWKAGLERLLLGYAMPGNDKHLFENILPFDNIEGESAKALGRLAELITRLSSIRETLHHPKTLKEWTITLLNIVEQLFDPDQPDESAMRLLKETFANMALWQDLSGFESAVSIDVIKEHLKKILAGSIKGSGFITGGVTFCALLPMRSIPFKVICLIGMNDNIFPRQSHEPGFNLIVHYPKRCDFSRKKDDRYLFLEAILSAGKSLYISYTGRNIKDNSLIPPSVVVSDLMDYLEQGFSGPGDNIIDHVLTLHPLQPFSPKYYNHEGKLFSYSEENCACAKNMAGGGQELQAFIKDKLPEPADISRTVDIADLINFFTNPAKFLLQTRLGVYQERADTRSDDRENFELSGLDRYFMEQDLLEKQIAGEGKETLHLLARARGILPHGTVGETICNKTIADISVFIKYLLPYLFTEKKEPVSFDVTAGEFRIKGRIENVYSRHSLIYRYAYLRPRDFLRLWIEHLSLGSFHGCIPEESFLIGLNDKTRLPCAWKFRAAENADEILEDLIKIFYEGLQRPVPFFSASSLLFAEAVMDEKPEEYGLQKARQKLFGNEYSSGEINDLYMSRCFGKNYEPDEQFISYSHRVYDPLLKNREEVMLPAYKAGHPGV